MRAPAAQAQLARLCPNWKCYRSEENLIACSSAGGCEKANAWLHQERYKRALVVNEIKNDATKVAISGTELKKLDSGGDTLEGRQNYDRSAEEFKLGVACNRAVQ